MSASQASALTAIAFQLAAALEAYEAELDRMTGVHIDPELYQLVAQCMDDMRMFAASLPKLSVLWVELMIRHFEYTHGLWRGQRGEATAAELQALYARLREATRTLHGACVREITEG
ncbi:hypothetical protein [Ramlibacter albus]|uniref:Uncharacterized protein n=1 Tax=Ramlibacter albus TaxID=2079448 RepID=A0A923M9F2_9BURK|nr:hypothetical protein [Ramlibacter albus]MBC5765326.1 hypothetical protein [Ramlibacter albus]